MINMTYFWIVEARRDLATEMRWDECGQPWHPYMIHPEYFKTRQEARNRARWYRKNSDLQFRTRKIELYA